MENTLDKLPDNYRKVSQWERNLFRFPGKETRVIYEYEQDSCEYSCEYGWRYCDPDDDYGWDETPAVFYGFYVPDDFEFTYSLCTRTPEQILHEYILCISEIQTLQKKDNELTKVNVRYLYQYEDLE